VIFIALDFNLSHFIPCIYLTLYHLAICLFPSLTCFKKARVTALNLLKHDVSAHLEQG